MKIGVKIALLAVSAAAGISIVFAMALSAIHTLDDMFTYIGEAPAQNLVYANNALNDVNNLARQTAMICFDTVVPIQTRLNDIARYAADIRVSLDSLESNSRTDTMKMYSQAMEDAIAKMGVERDKFLAYFNAGDMAAARFHRTHEYSKAINAVEEVAIEMTTYMNAHMKKYCFVDSHNLAHGVTADLIIIGVIAFAILISFSIVIIMGITKPLKKAVEAAKHVSNGNLKVDLSTTAKDETGLLMNSLEDMVSSVGSLIKDTEDLSKAAMAGKLEVRADTEKHKGSFKELIVGINGTLDAVIGPLNMTAEYVDRISKGDMPPRITDPYNGDFNEIKNNLNGCMDAIGLLITEVNQSINKALDGDFKYRADVNKFQGDFRKIMVGVNDLVTAFVEPLEVTSEFLQGAAVGSEGIKKMTKEYKGEFNVIKDSVNKVHDVLFTVLGGISDAADEAERGNLDVKADTSKVQGAWIAIMGGLNKITAAANAIMNDAGAVLSTMATGDLRPRITKDYPGHFGVMKDNINNLGDSLTDLISHLGESIHTTATASAQISATAETIATATHEQASQTEEVASAVEEMSRTVTDNAHNAGKTAEVAKKSGEVANDGGKVVQQTVAKMREISSVVQSSAQDIAKLGESSKKIGEIIGVIDDIADQTNLLSLNAAIEAARAGEQGRGFAVVADSVGKLAISTASATKEIAEMIKGIQSDTESAVRAMERGTSEVQSGIELADTAGTSIKGIVSGINELLTMMNQIAAASEEQSDTSEEISKNVSSISKVTAESARNIEDVAATANELAKMTESLTALISQFKIDESAAAMRRNLHRSNGSSYSTSSDSVYSSDDDSQTATTSSSRYLN